MKVQRRDYICYHSPELPIKSDIYDYGYGVKTVRAEHAAMVYISSLWDFLPEIPKEITMWIMDISIKPEKIYRVDINVSCQEVEFDG